MYRLHIPNSIVSDMRSSPILKKNLNDRRQWPGLEWKSRGCSKIMKPSRSLSVCATLDIANINFILLLENIFNYCIFRFTLAYGIRRLRRTFKRKKIQHPNITILSIGSPSSRYRCPPMATSAITQTSKSITFNTLFFSHRYEIVHKNTFRSPTTPPSHFRITLTDGVLSVIYPGISST